MLLEPKGNVTLEDRAQFVRSVASAGILTALNQIYKDDPAKKLEKAQDLKSTLDTTVIPLLQDRTVSVDATTEKLLLAKIPLEYQPYLQMAMAYLRQYYNTPQVGEMLTDDQWMLFISLFYGINDGLDLVIGT
jgi:hypothetical protein